MKKFLFTDLDDTIFQSCRKLSPEDSWTPRAFLTDGSAICYTNPVQESLLSFLLNEFTLIPVTARNMDAFRRVRIPFGHEAVINYGGVILDAEGNPDPEWLARSQQQAAQTSALLDDVAALLTSLNKQLKADLRVRIIADFGIPFYVVAKSESGEIDSINAAAAAMRSEFASESSNPAMFVHENHNNLALLPRWLDKRFAVEHLRNQFIVKYGDIITFGMGDSLIDLGFMGSCHYQLVPTASQISMARLGSL